MIWTSKLTVCYRLLANISRKQNRISRFVWCTICTELFIFYVVFNCDRRLWRHFAHINDTNLYMNFENSGRTHSRVLRPPHLGSLLMNIHLLFTFTTFYSVCHSNQLFLIACKMHEKKEIWYKISFIFQFSNHNFIIWYQLEQKYIF